MTRALPIVLVGTSLLALCAGSILSAQPPRPQEIPGKINDAKRTIQEKASSAANPFWQHVMGDRAMLPCTHMVKEHPAGDDVMAPCTHLKKQHPDGDRVKKKLKDPVTGIEKEIDVTVPCVHLVPEHPEGHPTGAKVPCVHLRPEHPEGHPGPITPCVHPMAEVSRDDTLGLIFYTNNQDVQQAARDGAQKLKELGVAPSGSAGALGRALIPGGPQESLRARLGGNPRSLAVFHHTPVHGDPTDNKDPMWSHYNPFLHYLQITKDERSSVSAADRRKDIRDTMFHELGHAICGHKCVVPMTLGKPHALDTETDPGQAVSEGWASFVALVIMYPRNSAMAQYNGVDYERLTTETRIPFSAKAEARVTAILWDLYDSTNEQGDSVSLGFNELFKVFSPTMNTMQNGPVIPDLNNYLDRLANNNPSQRTAIMAARDMNLTAPATPSRTPRPGRP